MCTHRSVFDPVPVELENGVHADEFTWLERNAVYITI